MIWSVIGPSKHLIKFKDASINNLAIFCILLLKIDANSELSGIACGFASAHQKGQFNLLVRQENGTNYQLLWLRSLLLQQVTMPVRLIVSTNQNLIEHIFVAASHKGRLAFGTNSSTLQGILLLFISQAYV